MGAIASSIPLAPQRSASPSAQNSSLVAPTSKELDLDLERIPYPSPESVGRFADRTEHAQDENDDLSVKDEDMSDVLPSIEDEETEEQDSWRVVRLGNGVTALYTRIEAEALSEADEQEQSNVDDEEQVDLSMGYDVNNSYDANDRYANLDVDERRRQEALLEAAEKPEVEGFDMARFLQRQRARGFKMIEDGWQEDTVELYLLIERREREVLFPESWRSQFPMFPADLFTNRRDPDAGLLRALTPKYDTTMKWALTKFLEMASRVRDNLGRSNHSFYKRRPEGLVEQHVKQYAKMAYKDVGIEQDVRTKHIPELFTFASAMYDTQPATLKCMILEKLRRRADRVVDLLRITEHTPPEAVEAAASTVGGRVPTLFHHNGEDYLYEPPTLYGIVSKDTIVGLVAYEPLGVVDDFRPMAWLRLSKDVFDVWNCIALALMVIWCRDHMISMLEILPERENDGLEMDVDDGDL